MNERHGEAGRAAGRATVGFKRHLRAEVVPGEGTYLFSGSGVTAVAGEHVEALAPLLDGTRTLPAVLGEVSSVMPVATAGRVVGELARTNLVGYRDPAAEREADLPAQAYWDLAGLDGTDVTRALREAPVEVVAAEEVDAEEARAACRESGLTVTDPGHTGDAALSLVLCEDYLAPELGEVDARHRALGRPWLLARPRSHEPWVGPVFTRDGAPCWACLAHRLRAHRRTELSLQQALGRTGPIRYPEASHAAGRHLGLHAAVLEAAKWLAGARHQGHRAIWALDTLTLTSRHHPVPRRPQCPECGDPGLVARQVCRPVVPASRPKVAGGGNHRALSPQQVRDRHRHLVDPVTGIVAGVHRDPRATDDLPSYTSGHNLALGGHTLAGLRTRMRAQSGGKGVTALEAEVSAMCEAVERYCGTRQGDEPVVTDTLDGLGDAAVHPNSCQLFAEWQFRDRERWNATHSAFHQICAPFGPARPVEWTPVWSLTAARQRLLPTSMLYFDPFGRTGSGGDEPWADSNGNAAGASLEDALVQGFLELVERDAVALWWYNRTRAPSVDLDAFDEPWLARLRDAYGRRRRDLWVLDLTSDLGVPAMVALSRRLDKPAEDIVFGFGAHFDPSLALRRAVTELGQLLPAVAEAQADGSGYAPVDPEPAWWWTHATVDNQPYLRPDPGQAPRGPSAYPYTPRPDLRQDIDAIEAMVRLHGMELLVLDQTRPDVELPVVKVIVPGLRHFWARFAPGRLFDVPVRLGRLSRPTGCGDLNPIPLFV